MRRSSSINQQRLRRQKWHNQPLLFAIIAAMLVVGLLAIWKMHPHERWPPPTVLSSNAEFNAQHSRPKIRMAEGELASSDPRLLSQVQRSADNVNKQQNTDPIPRLDMSIARNQLRTKSKQATAYQGAEFPLIIYLLLESEDPENEANLQYYVREAVREDDNCVHVILVDSKKDLRSLPSLPVENAKYVKRKKGVCQWGAIADYLRSEDTDLSKFTSFLVLTSELRGPFVPAYVKDLGVHWSSLFTSKLSNSTKLVGPLVSCQDIVWPDFVAEEERQHGLPHLPPQMFVTDRVGLDLLMKDPQVFTCQDEKVLSPIQYSAMRASQIVLQAGYNLDCLMQRYQGVRWSEKETWKCNAGLKANEGEYYYDGITVHPLEVMFVEVSSMKLRKGSSAAKVAKKYDKWKSAQAALKEDVTFNMYAYDPRIFRAPQIAYMEKRGPGCFDFNFYAESNPELRILNVMELWSHFVESGQFEDRGYRFNCIDLLARSFNCFDTNYYNRANEDLNELRLEGRPLSAQQAWSHFLEYGFFESRKYRFMDICGEDIDSPNNLGEGN